MTTQHCIVDKWQWLHDEFNIYLTLEKAYKPHDHIAPRCYGAFKGNGVAVLIHVMGFWMESLPVLSSKQ